MKVYIIYERFKTEFYGKYILGIEIIKNIPDVKEVKIGFYKDLILELLKIKPEKNEKIIIIYKDIWRGSEVLIDIAKQKNFIYLCHHEEEFTIYSLNNIQNYLNDIVSKKYFKKIDSFFTLSDKSKNILQKYYGDDKNILVSGNTKFDYLKLIKSKGFFKKNEKEYILLTLSDSYFKFRQDYKIYSKTLKNYNFDDFKQDQNKNANFDNAFFSICIRDQIKFFLKIIKKTPNNKYILRPHPNDISSKNLYEKVFRNFENVEIIFEDDVNYWISNSQAVISGPCFTSMEANILGVKNLIYFDKKNKVHNTLYQNHLTLKFFSENIIRNLEDFINKISQENKINDNFIESVDEYYSIKKDSFPIIINLINKYNRINFENKNNIIFDYFLKNVSTEIENHINQKKLSEEDYNNFRNKFKISLSRLYFYFKFFDSSNNSDFINLLYKYCRGRNFYNHSKDLHMGKFDQIDKINLKKFTEFYFSKTFSFDNQVKLLNNKRVLTIQQKN